MAIMSIDTLGVKCAALAPWVNGDATTETSSASAETTLVRNPRWDHHDGTESLENPVNHSNNEERRTLAVAETPSKGFMYRSSALERLCEMDFFKPCKVHAHLRNSVLNFFVLDEEPNRQLACCRHSDLVGEGGARPDLIQIRRYMHRNVVLVEDMATRYDCKGIQMYYINQKRAILLQPKDPSTSSNPVYENYCARCRVPLRPDCVFCSLSCSIHAPKHVHISGLTMRESKKRRRPPSSRAKGTTEDGQPPPRPRTFRSERRAWSRKLEHPDRSPE